MNPYEQAKDLIRDLDGPEGLTRYFHLTPCGGCGQPVWQQPCPLCGYYPMGNDPAERKRCRNMGVEKVDWLRYVVRHGGLAQWYISGYKRTVAWRDFEPGFRDKIERLLDQSKALELPDAIDVYNAVMATWKNASR